MLLSPYSGRAWSHAEEKVPSRMFTSEREMHEWLIGKLRESDGVADLVINSDYLEGFQPRTPEESRLHESFSCCLEALYINYVITSNENISLKPGDTLCPDVLMYAPETQSAVIVELKNIAGPTRQAGTELSAYAAELRSYVPFISDGEIVNVVISTCWPTLLRHYVVHEVFWLHRKMICLEPVLSAEGPALLIKSIPDLLETDLPLRISARHLGGYHLCLYDDSLYSVPRNRTRLDAHLTQMRTALAAMATKGNALRGHGFALLWKSSWELSLAPYTIALVNFAAFQSIERFLHPPQSEAHLTPIQRRLFRCVQEHSPDGASQALAEIEAHGSRFFVNICSPQPEGFSTWDQIQRSMENHHAEMIAFQGWGLFGEMFSKRLAQAYEAGDSDTAWDCPTIGLSVVSELIDSDYDFVDVSHWPLFNDAGFDEEGEDEDE